jgi:peroxiredoxin/predicted 2-oxoglutarate/Fe(II)-dependent dioxygenase YbiX
VTERAPERGEPAPWFRVRADCNPTFHFHSVAGRPIVLFFLDSAARADSRAALEAFLAKAAIFDGNRAALLVVTTDPKDEALAARCVEAAGLRVFFDFDHAVSKLYGVTGDARTPDGRATYVLDARLRVLERFPFAGAPEAHVARVLDFLRDLEPPSPLEAHAPVLCVPRLLDPALCEELIRFHTARGGEASGFMRDINGRTELVHDAKHKVREDSPIPPGELRDELLRALTTRLVPEIRKAFQFEVTRVERHLVARYDAEAGAHFRRHRDNTTLGTAHRRFAVTVNLNVGAYEGGDLRLPEFGTRTYVPPTGAALVFSCSLLHEVRKVTRGVRYAYLPFLYDEAAAAVRRGNEAASREPEGDETH